LRRRHPWLHTARTAALHLANSQYVYRTSADEGALVVALNVDDAPLRMSLSEFGIASARIVAGSGAPEERIVDRLDVEPHGWAVLAL
jgi:cyclomaltodextrinase / maltogenic alpha-amylase / neopullulanase